MNRRLILLISLGVLVILFAGLGYYVIKGDPEKVSSLQFVPASSDAIIVMNNYASAMQGLTGNNLMWQELTQRPRMAARNNAFLSFDSLVTSFDEEGSIRESLRMTIYFEAHGDQLMQRTYIIPFPGLRESQVADLMASMAFEMKPYGNFEEVEIRQLSFKDTILSDIYFCMTAGHLLASEQPDLLEASIRSFHNGTSVYSLPEFETVAQTTGNFSDWNVFVNCAKQEGLQLFGLDITPLEEQGIRWSGWTALDAIVHPNLLLMSGFTTGKDSIFLSAFNGQKPQETDVIEIVPDDVAGLIHFGISNYGDYIISRKKYLQAVGRMNEYTAAADRLLKEYQLDLETELTNWVANEFGVMLFEPESETGSLQKVAFFRLSDRRRALAVLNNLSEGGIMHEAEDQISQLAVEELFEGYESAVFSGLNQPWFSVVDKYLVLSNSKERIEHVRHLYKQDQTLKKNQGFTAFSSNLSDQSNVSIILHSDRVLDGLNDILDKQFKGYLTDNREMLKKFEYVGVQIKDSKRGLYYQHMALSYNPVHQSKGNLLWDLTLDTLVTMKPVIVYNHYTNAREIFVQDVANKIYLIDNKGNILWKRQMKEPIKSQVYQIDVYKNNKLQILFSGESSIYLIDRKGRDVESFPVQLPALSTNGIAVIDYEKNREYRILIGVRGGKILNYDRFGKPVDGWSFQATEEIVAPINYFLLNGKDYLITVGSEGHPFILNRRGEERIALKESLPKHRPEFYSLELSNDIDQCRIITTDATGNVIKLRFNGTKEVINFQGFSARHQLVYDDLNHDRKPDYLFLDSLNMYAYDHSREKLFELELPTVIRSNPTLYHFDNNATKIGFSDAESEKLYLYTTTGGMHESFPLSGSGEFTISDLNKDGHFNLITGSGNKLVIYNLP